MKHLICLICFLTICASAALGAPDVMPGRFVYTIPSGFDPPLIGRSGVAEIQQAASKLRFPYYVVLVESFGGETDQDAADYIDSLAQQWQRDPHFDSARSCIFMLSYSPRKYRFLSGSRWEHEIGFGPGAHAPFNAIFVKYISSSRKDPKTGIIRMMQAVDQHLKVETDPRTIAARKEAARKAEIARRQAEKERQEAEKKRLEEQALRMARDQLQSEVSALASLLASESGFLPGDVSEYQKTRETAEGVLQSTDRDRLLSEAAVVRLKSDELRQYVDARMREAGERAARAATRTAGIVVVVMVVLFLTIMRARRYGGLRREFAEQCGKLEEKINNAQPKYLAFEQERNMIAGLKELAGRTKEVYDTTTREVDDIFITIGAMQGHIDRCKGVAKRGSFLRVGPLAKAVMDLGSEFTIDTNQLSGMELFAPERRQVTLRPSEVVEQLEERFRRASEQWDHLKLASEIRFKQAEEVFPESKLDEMLKTADEHGIPHRWLSDHPLFGDDASDEALYSRVNEGRMNDPVAFLERLEDLQAKEAEVADRLNRLVSAIGVVKAEHLDSMPSLAPTVLQPQDDPAVTFDTAKREEARFGALLASRTEVAEVEEQAGMVRDLYRKCVEQAVMAQAAVEQAESEVAQARAQSSEVSALGSECEAMVAERVSLYANIGSAERSLANGRRYLEAAGQDIESASSMLLARRHLEAQNTARQAKSRLDAAKRGFDECRLACEELDESRRQFEQRLAELDTRREQYERRIRGYGRRVSLDGFECQRTSSPLDYLVLLNQLDTLQDQWESQLRIARRQHEEEEARRRADEEAKRRSSWSSSSSSGSSWRGSSSSSSGGSWGGSSSSSSSSSSGGSW